MFATSYGRRGCLGRAAPRPRGEDPGQRARGGSRCMANLCSPFGKPCGVSAAGSLYVLRALDGIATHSGMQHSKARSPGPGERAIAACSLAVLAAVLAGVCIRQTRFDPAVMMSAGGTPADIITAGSNLVCRMQTPAKTAASTAREQAAIALSPGPGLLALECCMPEWVAMPSNALRTYRLPAAETPHGLPKGLHKLAMQRLPPRARWPGSSSRGRGAARPKHPRRP